MINKKRLIPFLDLLFLLLMAFILALSKDLNKGKSVSEKAIPTIYVFIEKNDNEKIINVRCNGDIVSPTELREKIINSIATTKHSFFEVDFLIDKSVEYNIIHPYLMAIKSLNNQKTGLRANYELLLLQK